MRIDLLEKAVTGLSALAILLVAACVTFFSFVNKSSGIDDNVVNTLSDTSRWLDDQRALARGEAPGTGQIAFVAPTNLPPSAPQPTAPPAPGQPPAPVAQTPAGRDNYIGEEGSIPPNEQVPGVPWLRQQPGVSYFRPQGVSNIVYQKYQSFDDAWQLAQEGGGEFVETPKGPGYRLNWIDENSQMRRMAGLQSDDVVISVNGHPVGNSFGAGKQLYDQLKGEKRFAVKIIRKGQELILPFYVQ